jgi:hypothetical protein
VHGTEAVEMPTDEEVSDPFAKIFKNTIIGGDPYFQVSDLAAQIYKERAQIYIVFLHRG